MTMENENGLLYEAGITALASTLVGLAFSIAFLIIHFIISHVINPHLMPNA